LKQNYKKSLDVPNNSPKPSTILLIIDYKLLLRTT